MTTMAGLVLKILRGEYMGCLYSLTFPSGKQYIGITIRSFNERWLAHVKASAKENPTGVAGAIKKYGRNNVLKQVLVIADDIDYLRDLERKAVEAFNTLSPNGYNLVSGGVGTLNPSDVTRKRMSSAAKNRFSRKEELDMASSRSKESWSDQSFSKKMIAIRKAQATTPKYRAYAAERASKQWGDDAFRARHRALVSEKMKALWKNPVYLEKMAARGVIAGSDESRKMRSAAQIASYQKRRESGDSLQLSDEHRKALRESWADPVKKAARLEKSRATREAKRLKEDQQ